MNEFTKSTALPKVSNPRITRQNLVALKSTTDAESTLKMQCIRLFENVRSNLDCMSSMIFAPDKSAMCAQKGGHVVRYVGRKVSSRCAECDKPISSINDLRKSESIEDAAYSRMNYWIMDAGHGQCSR